MLHPLSDASRCTLFGGLGAGRPHVLFLRIVHLNISISGRQAGEDFEEATEGLHHDARLMMTLA